jgi:hypothetical protein
VNAVAVEVNEARIWATLCGGEWWRWFMERFRRSGRIRVVSTSLGGDLYRVAMDDRDHARAWINAAMDSGVPRTALRIVTSTSTGEGQRCTLCGTYLRRAEEPGSAHWYHPAGFCRADTESTGEEQR